MKCSYCQKQIKLNFLNLIKESVYCLNCFEQFELVDNTFIKIINTRPIKINIIYNYNVYAKNFLYEYKENKDLIIIKLFQEILVNYIKIKTNFAIEETLIIYPSSTNKNYQKRKFNPMKEIVDLLKYENQSGPKRLDNISQGKLNLRKRREKKQIYQAKELKTNFKNLLLIEDVITTGTTINNNLENIINLNEFQNIEVIAMFGGKNILKEI